MPRLLSKIRKLRRWDICSCIFYGTEYASNRLEVEPYWYALFETQLRMAEKYEYFLNCHRRRCWKSRSRSWPSGASASPTRLSPSITFRTLIFGGSFILEISIALKQFQLCFKLIVKTRSIHRFDYRLSGSGLKKNNKVSYHIISFSRFLPLEAFRFLYVSDIS